MNPNASIKSCFFALLISTTLLRAAPPTQLWKIDLAPQQTNVGIYPNPASINFTAAWRGEGPTSQPSTAHAPAFTYRVLEGQMREVAKGSVPETDDPAGVQVNLDHPGTLLFRLEDKAHNATALRGVVVAPEQIKPSAPKPDDFDSFWDEKFKELAAVPTNPQLTPKDIGKPTIDYSQITMDNIRGTHIRGQIARPHDGEKFPALLIVQWAGVYALDKSWVTGRAAEGWLCLNINAHDLPIDNDAQFYKNQFSGPLKNYWAIGNDDRDTSYFLRMYLSCYRAAEYLSNRPDWNGKTLVVMGGSQGGQQSLLTASIFPKITAALADVPAGCDMLGPDVGRRGGWPQWYNETQGKDAAKVHNASRYFDIVNFTPRIHCPILVGAGLIDETCPVAGVLAAVNQVSSPKEIHLFPIGPHNLEQQTHTLYNDAAQKRWLPVLVKDQPAPVHAGID